LPDITPLKTLGVKAVGETLKKRFGLEVEFIDTPQGFKPAEQTEKKRFTIHFSRFICPQLPEKPV